MMDIEQDDSDGLQYLVEKMMMQRHEQVLETSRHLDKDERLLPVHFLPEGQKCYDWIAKDLGNASDEHRGSNITNGEAQTNITLVEDAPSNGITCKDILHEYEAAGMCQCTNSDTNFRDLITSLVKLANRGDLKFPSNCITQAFDGSTCQKCDNKVINEDRLGTLLLDAAEHGEYELIRILLLPLPRLKQFKDEDGYTALHRASYNGHSNVVSGLIKEFDIDIASKTEDEWQPLHCACRWNQLEIAEILLESGANINAQTTGGLSPLHLASTAPDRAELLEMLLLHKDINPKLVNNAGETAYEIALRSGLHHKLFELVEESVNVRFAT